MSNLERILLRLKEKKYEVVSPKDSSYNCVAWTIGDKSRKWWPNEHINSFSYWPKNLPNSENLYSFKELYRERGYEECESPDGEEGFEKIAIFANERGMPTHVAHRTGTDMWSSKCDNLQDISHELEALEGEAYGSVICIMKRDVRGSTRSD